jgi:protein transport protein SEC24
MIKKNGSYLCNLCEAMIETKNIYNSKIFHDKNHYRARDIKNTPDLFRNTLEFVRKDKDFKDLYCSSSIPVFVYIFDVSLFSVNSDITKLVVETIKGSLASLSGNNRAKVGFLTFDDNVHFYNLQFGLDQPQVLVVSENEYDGWPKEDNLLVSFKDSIAAIETILEILSRIWNNTKIQNTSIVTALGVAMRYFPSLHKGGKLLVFLAPNKKVEISNTFSEIIEKSYENLETIRNDENSFTAHSIAKQCSRKGIAIDILLTSNQCHMDYVKDKHVFEILTRHTNGHLYQYSEFPVFRNRSKLSFDLRRNLTRTQGWFGLLTIRSSNQIKITGLKYHSIPTKNGSSCRYTLDSLFFLPCVNEDKAYPLIIALENINRIYQHGYLQSSFLYIDSEGKLRTRVHNRTLFYTDNLVKV